MGGTSIALSAPLSLKTPPQNNFFAVANCADEGVVGVRALEAVAQTHAKYPRVEVGSEYAWATHRLHIGANK